MEVHTGESARRLASAVHECALDELPIFGAIWSDLQNGGGADTAPEVPHAAISRGGQWAGLVHSTLFSFRAC
jgi:hypothetical protein